MPPERKSVSGLFSQRNPIRIPYAKIGNMKILDICKTIREKDRLAAILLTVLFVLQIIPILYLGRFSHPTSDDFKYGAYSHTAWQETGSLAAVVEAAAKGVAEDYRTWQGSYSALFLMRLEPTVFGAC